MASALKPEASKASTTGRASRRPAALSSACSAATRPTSCATSTSACASMPPILPVQAGQRLPGSLHVIMSIVWPQLEPLLLSVEKPARYIGCEDGSQTPEHAPHKVSWLLTYPDTYEI